MCKDKPTRGGRPKKSTEVSLVRSSAAEYLTFVAAGGDSEASVEMCYEDENVWLTHKMMAALYDVSVPAINQHQKRIFSDNELEEEAVVKPYLITHYAVHGQTAAEVIVDRADHERKNMGLTHWERAPKGKIHRYDVAIAKNYRSEEKKRLAEPVRRLNPAIPEEESAAHKDSLSVIIKSKGG